MQKKLLVALAAAVIAAPAFARLTIYGIADVGIEYIDLGPDVSGTDHSIARLTSGIMDTSFFGIKGEQKLDNGLKAGFQLEAGFLFERGLILASHSNVAQDRPVTGTIDLPLWGRVARVYLSTKYGEFSVGRQPSPMSEIRCNLEPSCGGFGFSTSSYWVSADRIDNSVKFTTNSVKGMSLQLAYSGGDQNMSKDEVSDPTMPMSGGVTYSASMQYDSGPVYVGAAMRKVYDHVVKPANLKPLQLTTYAVGMSYAFSKVKPFVSIQKQGSTFYPISGGKLEGLDDTIFMIGASVPMGRATLIGSMSFLSDNTNYDVVNLQSYEQASSRLFGVAYLYNLNKDVVMYASASKMINDIDGKKAWFSMATSALPAPALPQVGNNPVQLTIGMRYKF